MARTGSIVSSRTADSRATSSRSPRKLRSIQRDSRHRGDTGTTHTGAEPGSDSSSQAFIVPTIPARGSSMQRWNHVLLAGAALAIAGCGGSGDGGVRPEPPPAPAVVGVVEDARGSHARQVAALVSHTGGSAARVESVHIAFEDPTTLEELVEKADELLAGLPLSETPTPEAFAARLAHYDITNGSYSVNEALIFEVARRSLVDRRDEGAARPGGQTRATRSGVGQTIQQLTMRNA